MKEKTYPVNLSKKDRDKTAFLYSRLSRDDNIEGESYSIGNQKKLLVKVAKEKGYTDLVHFSDDGISGVTMERPGLKAMIAELEKGHASAVFVKDMSRLGRNYIEVGRLTEEFFPEFDIRLVAVSDNVDTAEGESELTPIRNLFKKVCCLRRYLSTHSNLQQIARLCGFPVAVCRLNSRFLQLRYGLPVHQYPCGTDQSNQYVSEPPQPIF